MELTPGALIADRYRVERKVGVGGMGEVWSGEHVNIGVRVALKTLLPAAACDPQIVARFRREAYLLGRMRSDRVARVVDFIEDPEFGLVLVMDFVDGEPLARVVEARRLGVEEAVDLGVDIVAALCELHRAKVVHRDLKPDNIMLEPQRGGRRRAVIVDFGVSRVEQGADEDELTGITHADMAVGTIPYMAPEQLVSSRDVSGAADLYAVGAILFRAVAGEHVFGDAEDMDYAKRKLTAPAPPLVTSRFDRVARGLSAIVARALERRPQDRFASTEEMLDELTSMQDVARAMGLDLEAATEQAPPPSSATDRPGLGELVELVDEATAVEQTRRMSRPPGALEDMLEERTQDSPGQDTERAAGPPSEMPMPASMPISVVVSSAAPAVSSNSGRGARPTVPSPEAPAPPAAPEPERAASRRAVPLGGLVAGMVAALLVGTALGFEAHLLLGEPAAAAHPRR